MIDQMCNEVSVNEYISFKKSQKGKGIKECQQSNKYGLDRS